MTQTGGVPTATTEGNFDTSDIVNAAGAVSSCTTLGNSLTGGVPNICTVTIVINGGAAVYSSNAGDPIDFENTDDGSVITSEGHAWAQVAAPTGYTLKLGYADNSHNTSFAACGLTLAPPCFPSPFDGATHFLGAGLPGGNGGACTGNCYDGGALLITGVLNAPPFTGCTVTQGGWGATPHGNNPAAFLAAHFPSGGVTIGASPLLDTFTSAVAVKNFLPQGGPPGALTFGATNPTVTSAGVFAGQVLALTLNVQLKSFGTYVLSGTGTSFDGKTVNDVLAAANKAISGGGLPAGFTFSSLNNLVDLLNNKFDTCS